MGIVVLLHIVLGWALISGTASQGLSLLMKPLKAVVIQEVAIQPPPPPLKIAKPVASKLDAAPPPFMPQVEMPVPVTTMAQIETSLVPPVKMPDIAPPPPAVLVAPRPSAQADIATVCPTQVSPEMPRRALIDGTQGVVRAQAKILDGVVREVTILSGPRIFQAAVRSAMLQYKCTRNSGEVMASQEFNFKLQ
jgi:protein TonB